MNKLENIKVGDEVVVVSSGETRCIKKVLKLTKTQIIAEGWNERSGPTRWKKNTGKEVGNNNQWNFTHIVPVTDEHRKEVEKRDLLTEIIHLCEIPKLRELSLEKLKQVVQILNSEE